MAKAKKTLVRGKKVPTFGRELVVFRTGRFEIGKKSTKRSEETRFLVKKAGTALKHPGISKKSVFKPGHVHVFAYSASPSDPKQIVRRSVTGKKTIGRLVEGRFKAS